MADEAVVPRIELAAARGPIPTFSAHLMPFHVQYSGPAPVTTYFRVKPSIDPSQATGASIDASKNGSRQTAERVEAVDSQETLVGGCPSLDPAPSTSSVTTLTGNIETSQMIDETATPSGKHFVAAFRGRTVRGTKIDLPEGFAGIVLSTPESTQMKPAVSAKALAKDRRRTRARKAASKKQAVQADEVEEEEADASMEGVEVHSGPVKILEVKGTFASFTLWHPDVPVDEGSDEYLRSLTEWTKIAAEVRLRFLETQAVTADRYV
ncbi:uncharacterized protein PHACADRAFT_152683 [Phanerochaete carnosa HHB-10118-sp]|uniref:Uncharacterized protein n=1 Tax=Phanerochaete carnosa (strain HHB-10118-sp) TaxID=650164 RepID=K5VH74_PHACS|nr:uncharacterized protein PHACADRAFT_152683 [Phanerochaete carnosa HHB-10118-sp]EKM50578.1 hypothetical protein PHACADRAFT_152683 [Phanerochaete carnosa HHB-10118-sp]